MHIYNIGLSGGVKESAILDANIVNPIVVAVSGKKDISNFFPDDLMWLLSSDGALSVDWRFGACEEYRQRAHKDKESVILYCNTLFSYIRSLNYQDLSKFLSGDSRIIKPSCYNNKFDRYNDIYDKHLISYYILLHLFSMSKSFKWIDFYQWCCNTGLQINLETIRFSKAFLLDKRGFPFSRLTHSSGSTSGDIIAKSAWNVAWDLVMLDHISCQHNSVLLTQDAALSDYWDYSRNVDVDISNHGSISVDIASLLITEERLLNIDNYFNDSLEYLNGVKNPF